MTLNQRFAGAMAAYAVLAGLAWWRLDGEFLIAVWIFLGGMALKTWLVVLKSRQD